MDLFETVKNTKEVEDELVDSLTLFNQANIRTQIELGRKFLVDATVAKTTVDVVANIVYEQDMKIDELETKVDTYKKEYGELDPSVYQKFNKPLEPSKKHKLDRLIEKVNKASKISLERSKEVEENYPELQ